MENKSKTPWLLPPAVILTTMVILAGVILLACHLVRERIREQIAGRDGHILYALSTIRPLNKEYTEEFGEMAGTPVSQLALFLRISELLDLEGVLAIRLFDDSAKPVITVPATVPDGEIAPDDLGRLKNFEKLSRFHKSVPFESLQLLPVADEEKSRQGLPLLEITLPLHSPGDARLLGIAQFLLDGKSIAAEFAALDRNLALQAVVAFLGSSSLVVLMLGLTFRRLQKANDLLSQRTQSLLQANQELALAAKTTAIGAVTSHLIHGLRNPLSGLQNFVKNRNNLPNESDTEWQAAIASTQRMQNLVSDVVRVLREENSGSQYEVTLEELMEMLEKKTGTYARQCGVRFQTEVAAEGSLINRNANLILLILENLLQNAIQATPPGRSVMLHLHNRDDHIVCEVRDEGTGLPEHYLPFLFKPCQSNKEGGSGIGLAISRQLANSIGAEVELLRSSPQGSVFALRLPKLLLASPASREPVAT